MQSENETIKEYTEPDGTRVRVRTIVTRTFPSGGGNSFGQRTAFESKLPAMSAMKSGSGAKGIVNGASAEFQKQFLDAHNAYRAQHGCPPVKINTEINTWAQEWATHLAETGSFSHRDPNQYGENLFMIGGTNLTLNGADSVKSWYDEIKDYKYFGQEPNMSDFSKWGHFTQVIWKSSTEIGVGLSVVDGNKAYVVGNYKPAGNMTGSFKNNVPGKI